MNFINKRRMKYRIALGLILILQCTCIAQYKNNKWLMGQNSTYPPPWGGSKIEFSNNSRIINYEFRNMNISDCFSSLSDKDENWFIAMAVQFATKTTIPW
jgi:hypothetical protein